MDPVALYRRWRPQTFGDLVGQEPVAAALQAAIREGRVSHAYLFSGPRGTGKTSTARILAKAMNCEQGPTPDPCNKCESCRSITEGSSLDVIEIDAASHGGVDDVRELRESVILSPAVSRKKVYIVDEAHMISTAGWNAFLKTIEEPPDHVLFVFATTEPQKVLPTIVSRCQRFDLRRVSSAAIASHLERICREERIDADAAALQLIARHADGSVRDALAVLDQMAATGSVDVESAATLLGSVPTDVLFDFAEALATREAAPALRAISRLVDEGRDIRAFSTQFLQHLRSLFLVQRVPDATDLIDATDEVRARLAAQAEMFGPAQLVYAMRLFAGALDEMRQQAVPRLALEMAVVRASVPEADPSHEAALARIERLERLLEVGERPAGAVEAPRPEPRAAAPRVERARKAPARAAEPAPVGPSAPEAAGGLVDIEKVRRSWSVFLEEVRKRSQKLHAYVVEARPVSLEGNHLAVEARSRWHADQVTGQRNAELLGAAFAHVFGLTPRFTATVAVRDTLDDAVEEAVAPAASEAPVPPGPEAPPSKPPARKPKPAPASGDLDAVEAMKQGLGAEVIEE